MHFSSLRTKILINFTTMKQLNQIKQKKFKRFSAKNDFLLKKKNLTTSLFHTCKSIMNNNKPNMDILRNSLCK